MKDLLNIAIALCVVCVILGLVSTLVSAASSVLTLVFYGLVAVAMITVVSWIFRRRKPRERR